MKTIQKLLFIAFIFIGFSCSNEENVATKELPTSKEEIVEKPVFKSHKYFRHLVYNHYSPYFPIRGNYEIDSTTATTCKHYIFKYNLDGTISKITNLSPGEVDAHPLTHLVNIDSVIFSYTLHEESRIFFGNHGKRVRNMKSVYKEVYLYNDSNKLVGLDFKDMTDNSMNSNWSISKYRWTKQNNLIVEKRYSLAAKLVNISPYFQFGITGMEINGIGLPVANYNLDENYNVINSSMGVASYKDTYDSNNNQVSYSYYDKNEKLTTSPYQFAIGRKYYDYLGNLTKEIDYSVNNELVYTANY